MVTIIRYLRPIQKKKILSRDLKQRRLKQVERRTVYFLKYKDQDILVLLEAIYN